MAKRKHIIEFPPVKGNYWYLFWIGRVHYTNKQRKINFYFYNKINPNDTLSDLDYNSCVVKPLPVSYLSEYGIGTIYNVIEQTFETLPFDNIYDVKINDIFRMTQNEFPLIGNKYFIKNSKQIIDQSYKYLKFFGKNRFNKSRIVLISPYTILQYLLFYNDKLIKMAFSGELLSGFNFNKMRIYDGEGEDAGKRIAELHYDASKFSKEAAIIISPYLFIKNEKGTKFIKSIYSHVQQSFLNYSKGEKAVYLNIYWEFEKYSLSAFGKELYAQNIDKKDVDYLFAYRITNFIFHDPKPYTVDEIRLYPFNARNSTKDRKNHDPEDVTRFKVPDTRGLSLNLTKDSVNNGPSVEVVGEEFRNPFQIPVTIVKREKQKKAYNITTDNKDEKKDAVTREIENLSEFADAIIENIKNSIITIGNFEYFKKVIVILKEKYLSKDSNFILKEFSGAELQLPFQFVEVSHLNNYIYFVEFGSGIIGVFNKVSYVKIPTEVLSLLGTEFNECENKIKETSKILWTYIRREYSRDYLSKGIVIQLGAKHDRPRKEEGIITDENVLILNAASRTAQKLYETRIVNNIL